MAQLSKNYKNTITYLIMNTSITVILAILKDLITFVKKWDGKTTGLGLHLGLPGQINYQGFKVILKTIFV